MIWPDHFSFSSSTNFVVAFSSIMAYGNIAHLVVFSFVFGLIQGTVASGSHEKEIFADLVQNYGSLNVIPVKNSSKPINVTLRLLIAQLVEFNEPKQQLTINGWQKMSWRDEFLVWDPDDYGGQDHIYVLSSDIWVPRLVVLENVQQGFTSVKDVEVIVQADGALTWYAPVMFQTSCNVHVKLFPFDVQSCNLTLMAWSYDLSALDLHHSTDNDTRQAVFSPNGVWRLEDVAMTRHEQWYACCWHPYPQVVYTLRFGRESRFYIMSVLVPSFLLKMVALMVFWLPPESGEKVSLSMTNLLAFVLFQQLIAGSMPPLGDETSIITIYIFCMVVEACAAIGVSVCVLRLFHRPASKPIPMKVVKFLAVIGYRKALVTWKTVARVLDKTMFVIFLLVSLLLVPMSIWASQY